LAEANVVLYDALANEELLSLPKKSKKDIGKEGVMLIRKMK
jgi:siroheme synthase